MLAADVTSPNATRSVLRTFWNVLMILPPPAVVWAINDGADLRLAADHGKNVVLSSFLLSHYFFFRGSHSVSASQTGGSFAQITKGGKIII